MSSIAALLQAAEYIERRERGMRKTKNGWEIEVTALILSWISFVLPTFFDRITAKL